MRNSGLLVLTALSTMVGCFQSTPSSAPQADEWNSSAIQWRSFDEGLVEADAIGRPICLVIYTDWCSHCENYKRVFHDKALVAATQDFVMIRVNQDDHPNVAARFGPDGQYIPRTLFLDSKGVLLADVQAGVEKDYRYFYVEDDPASLLRGMKRAAYVAQAN